MTTVTVAALTMLHYGSDYLASVIKSTEGIADSHLILYTERPSYRPGHPGTGNTDTKADLQEIAISTGGRRVEWAENWPISVESAFRIYPDLKMLLVLDADEVISEELSRNLISEWFSGRLTVADYRLPMIHHWRSFRYVCRDSNHPVRLYLPHNPPGAAYLSESLGLIHHFGYARKLADMRYKMELSLHREEFRPGWWDEIFLKFPERLTDLHPVCLDGFWNAEEFPADLLPRAVKTHPYRNLEVIS